MYADTTTTDSTTTTTTSSLQPTTTSVSVSVTTTTTSVVFATEVPEIETPVTERPEFIVAMIVVGLVVLLVLCVVMLCFVRPRQGPDGQRRRRKQPLTIPSYSGVLTPSSTNFSDHGWVPSQPPVVTNCYHNYMP